VTNPIVATDQQLLVVALMAALEGGAHGPELMRFFHPEVTQIEYPSLIDPRLMHHDAAAMIAGSERGAGMLAYQRYDVDRWIESGDTVVCQARWHAQLAKDAGPLREGLELDTYSLLIFTFRDGLIFRQEAYDCYVPFA
jgi:hypothetical protein